MTKFYDACRFLGKYHSKIFLHYDIKSRRDLCFLFHSTKYCLRFIFYLGSRNDRIILIREKIFCEHVAFVEWECIRAYTFGKIFFTYLHDRMLCFLFCESYFPTHDWTNLRQTFYWIFSCSFRSFAASYLIVAFHGTRWRFRDSLNKINSGPNFFLVCANIAYHL